VALGDSIDDLGKQRSEIIHNLDDLDMKAGTGSTVTRVSTAPIPKAVNDEAAFAARQLLPDEDVATVKGGISKVTNNPAISKKSRTAIGGIPPRVAKQELGVGSEVTGRELLPMVRVSRLDDLARGTRAKLRNVAKAYAGGRPEAEIARDKAVLRGANEAIATADPAIKPIADKMAHKITLEDFLERGTLRSGKHMLMDGFDMIAATHNPSWLAVKLAHRGGIGSQAARGLYRAGNLVEGAKITPLMERLALLAALESRSPDEPAK
jgi:hypothetical protein